MRQDQKEHFSIGMKASMEKILLAIFSGSGATKIEQIIPSADEMTSEAVDVAFGSVFSEEELDQIIDFEKKLKDKTTLSQKRVEAFIEQYMKEHEDELHEALSKL